VAGVALILISCFTTANSVNSQEIPEQIQTVETVAPIEQIIVVDVKDSTEYQKELAYLSLTIYGEARGESDLEMKKVGSVILNRTKSGKYPSTVEEVVLQPQQFTVWNRGNPNYRKMLTVHALDRTSQDWKAYRRAYRIAAELLETGPVIKALSFDSLTGSHKYR
jgi:spore germination cell wall hydrolase CwlJ-like protein